MPKSHSNPQTPPWLPHPRAPSWQLPSPSCLGPHGLDLDGRHLCTLLLALLLLLLLLLLLFLCRCVSPAVPTKPVCYVFPVASRAKKWKGMMEKKKKKWLSENMREKKRGRERERESEGERDWVSVFGMFFAVCSVFTARGFIRLSAGPWARLNGHRCPVWAWNLLLAPLAPLACLHPSSWLSCGAAASKGNTLTPGPVTEQALSTARQAGPFGPRSGPHRTN